MAKMFYTLEEVSQKLGRTEDEVKEMARSGQLQEFRDRDRLMFKVEQIDLLAGGEEDDSAVHLELVLFPVALVVDHLPQVAPVIEAV